VEGLDRLVPPGEVDLETKHYRLMKTQTVRTRLFASLGAASLVVLNATAQTPAPTTTATPAPAATDIAPVKLPYGVEDVLKLSRAQVSDDVTLNFIHNSGTIYNLGPSDIVYLRNQGVSDRVINTMLDQRKNVPAETAAQAAPPASPAPVYSDANAAAAAQAAPQYAPTYAQPAPVYVQPEPTYVPASTVYVIPYSPTRYYYPSYSPYWGRYYSYCGPSFGFSYGYRSGGYYGGYHGGYSGGGHYRYYGRR